MLAFLPPRTQKTLPPRRSVYVFNYTLNRIGSEQKTTRWFKCPGITAISSGSVALGLPKNRTPTFSSVKLPCTGPIGPHAEPIRAAFCCPRVGGSSRSRNAVCGRVLACALLGASVVGLADVRIGSRAVGAPDDPNAYAWLFGHDNPRARSLGDVVAVLLRQGSEPDYLMDDQQDHQLGRGPRAGRLPNNAQPGSLRKRTSARRG